MPTLVIDLLGRRKRVRVGERAYIGRTPGSDVAIEHPAISRTHALIHCIDGDFVLEDIGSSNGTMVDGIPLRGKHVLRDGAHIAMGPANIIFHGDDAVIDTAQPEQKTSTKDGLLLNCSCGARLWVPEDRIGGMGLCPQCGATVALGERAVCSICQWEMMADAQTHRCPDCGLTFHAECWQENRGCSAYGCAQVNALADPRDAQVDEQEIGAPPQSHERRPRASWEKPLLAASVAASLLGIIAFGLPALLVAILAARYLREHRGRTRAGPLGACIMICVLGLIAGIAVSGYWWLGWTIPR